MVPENPPVSPECILVTGSLDLSGKKPSSNLHVLSFLSQLHLPPEAHPVL